MVDNRISPRRRILALVLTLTGASLGLLLATLAVWADYESTAYGFLRRAQTPLNGLACPIFIGRNESQAFSVTVSNTTDQSIFPAVRTEVSTSQEFDLKIDSLNIAPGGQAVVQRIIGPQNIDMGNFIFVYAFVYSAYPLPYQENTCGILVLPVTSGRPVLILGTTLTILLMAVGMFFLHKNAVLSRQSGSMVFLVVTAMLAMIFGFQGWWLQGMILIVISILTLAITIGNLLK